MRVPQVNERVKEAPASALRAMFAGIGSLLSVTDKIRAKPAGEKAAEPKAAAPETPAPAGAAARDGRHRDRCSRDGRPRDGRRARLERSRRAAVAELRRADDRLAARS